jgi:hypothetical protein
MATMTPRLVGVELTGRRRYAHISVVAGLSVVAVGWLTSFAARTAQGRATTRAELDREHFATAAIVQRKAGSTGAMLCG